MEIGSISFSAEVFQKEHSWKYQQYNNSKPTAYCTRQWISRHGIGTLKWPDRYPDLNLIENMWSEVARLFYRRGRKFEKVDDLEKYVMEGWDNISKEYILKLFRSIFRRLLSVIGEKGVRNVIERYMRIVGKFRDSRFYALFK